jgi:hypothetical protein
MTAVRTFDQKNQPKPPKKRGTQKKKKNKGLKYDRKPVPNVPVFLYTSKCCEETALKEPCARRAEDKESLKFSEATLGTWTCPKCNKKCKVTRKRNTEGTTVIPPVKR